MLYNISIFLHINKFCHTNSIFMQENQSFFLKSRLFFLFFIISLFFSSIQAQTPYSVIIGSGIGDSRFTPIVSNAKNSYTQSIYYNTEIDHSGTICKIGFLYTATPGSSTLPLTIYMGHTTQTSFSSNYAWISTSTMTEVFSGDYQFSYGWNEIVLHLPFSYNGTQNLIVTCHVQNATEQNTQFKSTQYGEYRTLYYNSRYAFTSPSSGTRTTTRSNIQLFFDDCQYESMSSSTLTTCEVWYQDPGGAGNYGANQNITQTVTSPNGEIVSIDFSSFSLGNGDYLEIYEGIGMGGMLLGRFTGGILPPTVTSSQGSLTFHFVSDGASQGSGWRAYISCQPCAYVSTEAGSPCHEGSIIAFCSDDSPLNITYGTGNNAFASKHLGEGRVGCLTSVERPSLWCYTRIADPGDLLIKISRNNSEFDYICWGPFHATTSQNFLDHICCDYYDLTLSQSVTHHPYNGNHSNGEVGGYPVGNIVDCASGGYTSTRWCFIPDAQVGEYYLFLLTANTMSPGQLTFESVQTNYTEGSSDCSILLTLSNNGPICEGDLLILSYDEEVAGATYSWSGPNGFTSSNRVVRIPNATTSQSGTYTLTITVNGQVYSTGTTTVVVNSVPQVTLNPDTLICPYSTVRLQAGGANTYRWSHNSSVTTTYANVSPGTTTAYTVTGTSYGCWATATATVSVNPFSSLSINTSSSNLCPGDEVTLVANHAGGNPPYHYQWSGTGVVNVDSYITTLQHEPMLCNWFDRVYVTVTDAIGCTRSNYLYLSISDLISPTISSFPFPVVPDTLPDGSTVMPDMAEILAGLYSDNCTDTADLIITQSPPPGTPLDSSLLSSITITDACGRSTTISTLIIAPNSPYSLVSNYGYVSCFGENDGFIAVDVYGGTPPYTYQWSDPELPSTDSIYNLAAGTYTVTITDSLGFSSVLSYQIIQPSELNVDIFIHNYPCGSNDGNIQAQVTGGTATYSYSWNVGGWNNYKSYLSEGTYSVTVTDANGCVASDAIFLPSMLPSITSTIYPDTCGKSHGSIALDVVDPVGNYLTNWAYYGIYNSEGDSAYHLLTGTYSVRVGNAHCTTRYYFTIGEVPESAVNFSLSHFGCINVDSTTFFTDLSDNATSWLWDFGDGQTSTQQHPDHAYNVPGLYNVSLTVVDSNACFNDHYMDILVTQQQVVMGETDTLTSGCVTLFLDPGGLSNYDNNTNLIQTFTSEEGEIIRADFYDFSLAAGDSLFVYDGWDTLARLIGIFTGNSIPSSISTTGRYITFHFVTNSSLVSSGWQIVIHCITCNPTATNLGSPCNPESIHPFCTDENPQGIEYFSGTGGNASTYFGDGRIACYHSTNFPSEWYYMRIADPGNMLISISQAETNGTPMDVDFICWGPFHAPSKQDFLDNICCGYYTLYTGEMGSHAPHNGDHEFDWGRYPMDNLVDCSYDGTFNEWCFIPNAQEGEYYLLLITNYTGRQGIVSFNSVPTSYTSATTDCNLLTLTNNNGPLCEGDTLLLFCENDRYGVSYLWNGPNGFTSTERYPSIPNVTLNHSGEYTLQIFYGGEVSEVDTTRVYVYDYPYDTYLTTSASYICYNDSILITAIGAQSYLWCDSLGSDSAIRVSPTEDRRYSVTASNNRCSILLDTLVIVKDNPEITLTQFHDIFCYDVDGQQIEAAVVGGAPPYAYQWEEMDSIQNDVYAIIYHKESWLCDNVITIRATATDTNYCKSSASTALIYLDDTPPSHALPISDTAAIVTERRFYTPNLIEYARNFVWDNCTAEDSIMILQTPAAGSEIFENTLLTFTFADYCQNISYANVWIIIPDSLIITIDTLSHLTCYQSQDGVILTITTGGTPPYRYSWNSDSTEITPNLTEIPAGNHQVTVTDFYGFEDSLSVIITQPDSLWIQSETLSYPCRDQGGSITVFATGGTTPYHYLWSTGATSDTIFDLLPGSYQVTVTDAHGCSDQITIALPDSTPLISMQAISPNYCAREDGWIVIQVENVAGEYLIDWNGITSFNNDSAYHLPHGAYQIFVTGNHCQVPFSFEIDSIGWPTAQFNIENEFLFIDSALIITDNSIGAISWAWEFGDGNNAAGQQPNHEYDTPGTYTILLTVVDIHGCEDIESIRVPVLEIPFTMIDTFIYSCNLLFQDPGGFNDYDNNTEMFFTIVSENEEIIHLSFLDFHLASGDQLCIYDGYDSSYQLIGCYTGDQLPVDITSHSPSLTFYFSSDGISVGSGWLVRATCIPCTPASTASGSPCHAEFIDPFCTGDNPSGVTYYSGTSGYASSFFGRNSVACLNQINRPSNWFYMRVDDPGNLLIHIVQTDMSGRQMDVDFACWGPFHANNNLNFLNNLCCGYYDFYTTASTSHAPPNGNHQNDTGGYPIQNLIDCSYSGAATEWCFIPDAQPMEYYLLLITNYSGRPGTVTFNNEETDYTEASTDCSILALANNNGPLCENNTLRLSCANDKPGIIYQWTGPNQFSSSLRNPVIENVTIQNIGDYILTLFFDGDTIDQDTTTVVIYEYPEISITSSSLGICNGDTVTLFVQGADHYLWDDGLGTDSTLYLIPTSSTTYQVSGTTNICTTTEDIFIEIPDPLALNVASLSTHYCPHETDIQIVANVSGGKLPYTYQWLGDGIANPNHQSATFTSSSIYCDSIVGLSVTVTDTFGCVITGNTNLRFSDFTPPVIGGEVASAAAQVLNVEYVIPNLLPPIQGATTDNCTSSSLIQITQAPEAGTVITENTTVTVTAIDYCGNSSSVQTLIVIPPPLAIAIQSTTNLRCHQDQSGAAEIVASGGTPPYSYQWSTSPVQNTATATSLSATTYTVTVTDVNGFQTTTSVSLSEPELLAVVLNPVHATCFLNNGTIAAAISGGVAPYSYSWSHGDSSQVVEQLSAGNYSVTVSDAHLCTITSSMEIDEITPPALFISDSSTTTCRRSNGFLEVDVADGTEPFIYQWNSGEDTRRIENIGAGTYSVVVTDANQCRDSIFYTIIDVTPVVSIDTISPEYCYRKDGWVIIDVRNNINDYSIDWTPIANHAGNQAYNLYSGNYTIFVTDGDCEVDFSFYIPMIPGPIADFSFTYSAPVINTNTTIQFLDHSTGAIQWHWEFGDGGVADSQNPYHQFVNADTYTTSLAIEDVNQCSDTTSMEIVVQDVTSIYIPNAFSPGSTGENAIFKPVLHDAKEENYYMAIYDRYGTLVFYTENSMSGWDGQINGKQQTTTSVFVYIIQYQTNEGKKHIRKGTVVALVRNG